MIFPDLSKLKIYLCIEPVDMRKAVKGLSLITESTIKQNPCSGNLFTFCNRPRTIIKILYWERNGFCLWQKKLKREKFHWPKNEMEAEEIRLEELHWLLNGLDYRKAHKFLEYNSVMLQK